MPVSSDSVNKQVCVGSGRDVELCCRGQRQLVSSVLPLACVCFFPPTEPRDCVCHLGWHKLTALFVTNICTLLTFSIITVRRCYVHHYQAEWDLFWELWEDFLISCTNIKQTESCFCRSWAQTLCQDCLFFNILLLEEVETGNKRESTTTQIRVMSIWLPHMTDLSGDQCKRLQPQMIHGCSLEHRNHTYMTSSLAPQNMAPAWLDLSLSSAGSDGLCSLSPFFQSS